MTDSTAPTTTPEETVVQTEQPTVFDINGEQVTLDELKAGYFRQADYTRKTQELAKEREELAKLKSTDPNDPDAQAEAYLQSKEYVKKSDVQKEIEKFQTKLQQEQEFERFIDRNPDLLPMKDAIRDLGKNSDKAREDIVVQYGLSTKDKLSKAKNSRDVKGNLIKPEESKPKSIKDMSPEEYNAWKASVPKDSPRQKKQYI